MKLQEIQIEPENTYLRNKIYYIRQKVSIVLIDI